MRDRTKISNYFGVVVYEPVVAFVPPPPPTRWEVTRYWLVISVIWLAGITFMGLVAAFLYFAPPAMRDTYEIFFVCCIFLGILSAKASS